jgi:hypothetical protein
MINNEDTRGFLLRYLVEQSSIPPVEKEPMDNKMKGIEKLTLVLL